MTDTAKKFSAKKFFRETKAEMKKVSWPSRKDVFRHTQVVIISIVFIGLILWLVDLAFGSIVNLLIMK